MLPVHNRLVDDIWPSACPPCFRFETFDVPALHIGVQAVLALYASWAATECTDQVCAMAGACAQPGEGAVINEARHSMQDCGGPLTGVVVDSGHGCTHIIPVVDGYVISSAIRTMPLAVRVLCMAQGPWRRLACALRVTAKLRQCRLCCLAAQGRDVTLHVQQLLRSRSAPVPPDRSLEVAGAIKEQMCYVCSGGLPTKTGSTSPVGLHCADSAQRLAAPCTQC